MSHVPQLLQLLGVAVAGVGAMALKDGSWIVGLALTLGGIALVVAGLRVFGHRIDRRRDAALAALAREQLTVTRAFLSTAEDVLIATDGERMAICELSRSGAVLSTQIARPDELRASAQRAADGRISVRVTYQQRDYDVSMRTALRSGKRATQDDDAVWALAEWWVATLNGERPSTDVEMPLLLDVYSFGWPPPALMAQYLERYERERGGKRSSRVDRTR
jgi:hypothetical protein